MRRHVSYLCVIFLAAISCIAQAQTSGTLDVRLNAPSGSPSGFVIVASLSFPDTAAGFTGQRAFASVTDANGRVSFTGLPFGVYSVCAEPRDGIHVESCQWRPPDTVHLTAENTSGTVSLNLMRGIPVEIRVDDPDGLLTNVTAGQGISVGVVTPQGPVWLRSAAQDAAGVNYRIMAPPSVAASIQIAAGPLRLLDTAGAPVNFSSPASAPSFNLGPTVNSQFYRYTLRKSQ